MKAYRLIVPFFVVAGLVAGQQGTDSKARLTEAMTAAQKAYDAGNFDQAEELLNGVRSLVHDDFNAVMLRARVNYDLQDWGKAESYAQRAAELDPKSFEARFLTGKALYQKAEAAKAEKLASGTRVQGFYEAALGEFDRAQKMKPDHAELPLWRARALFWLNRVPEAIAVYEGMRKARPDDPEPLLYIAQAHLDTQNEDAALKAAIEGLATKGPSNLRGDLANVVFRVLNPRGKFAEMYAAFKPWSAAHPNDPQAWLWMGYARLMEKNVDEAIAHYQKGFEVSGKKHSGCALELGNVHWQKAEAAKGNDKEWKAELQKAAEWYGIAARLQSEWGSYDASPLGRMNGVAAALIQKRDFAGALELLEKNGFPAAESDWKTLNNLGLFYRDWADSGKRSEAKARNEKALGYYMKAGKLVVDDPNATGNERSRVLNDVGVIYHYQLGNMEKGIEYYRVALQHDPLWVDALENLGVCFNALGKYEEAIPLFEKVLDQQPGRGKSQNGLAEAKKAVSKDQKPTSR
jgi:tetratricopeptide (TPR) repeat protein